MSSNIPEFMPVLSTGGHDGPHKGACVMEYISLLAGEKWSDEPDCTHPLLAAMARGVNDRMCDKHRSLLIPLIPRLMGTGDFNDSMTYALEDWLSSQCYGCGSFGIVNYSVSHAMAGAESCDHPYDCQRGLDLLTRMLDRYDQVTGRTEVTPLTEETLRFMSEVVAQ